MDEEALKQYEEKIAENLQGWVTHEELIETIPEFNIRKLEELKKYVNNRDIIHIRSTSNTSTASSYFIKHKTDRPFRRYKEQIPEDTHEVFDKWVGMGRSPKVITGLIDHLTNPDRVQWSKTAEEHGCTDVAMRNHREQMIEELEQVRDKVWA